MKQVLTMLLISLIFIAGMAGFVFLAFTSHPVMAFLFLLLLGSLKIKVGEDDDKN